MDTRVFVIGSTGKRLMPTTPRKARILLKSKKAVVYKKIPFTIKLLYKTGGATQPISLGIDTGSQHIGIAVVTEGKVIYQSEIELRNSMEKRVLMEKRREFRRNRRYRKVRYRKPKFRHHTIREYSEKLIKRKSTGNMTHWVKKNFNFATNRREGWLPPSIQSKIDHHICWIQRFLDVLPSDTKLTIEIARFDVARMKDPSIHGELYQKGPQYDYENVKAYVFDRDGYKCKVCGAKGGSVSKSGKTVTLRCHHILFKSQGATDNPDQMITICTECHSDANHKEGGILYKWREKEKKFERGYRDAAFMNALSSQLSSAFSNAFFTYGNITAADRKRLRLSKGHSHDAIAIAAHEDSKVIVASSIICYRQVRKKKRSLHEANPRKGLKGKKNTEAIRHAKNKKEQNGVFLWDKVSLNGEVGWVSSFSGTTQCRIDDKNNKKITVSKKYDSVNISNLHVISHNNNWIWFVKDKASSY